MNRGRLITIEGLDGAGKTTLARRRSAPRCASAGVEVRLLREPGGVQASERIRDARQGPRARAIGARAEALLYAAARAQLVEEALEPLLGAGDLGAARPLRRLLARLPGRRPASSGSSAVRADQRVRDRRPARPTGRCCWRSIPSLGRIALASAQRAARPARARGARTSSTRIADGLRASSRPPNPSGSA